MHSKSTGNIIDINIDITVALLAVFYIARLLACNILYLPEGTSPTWRYFCIAWRDPRARVLYDFTARMHEDDIVYIRQRAQWAGIALKTKYSPLVDILIKPPEFVFIIKILKDVNNFYFLFHTIMYDTHCIDFSLWRMAAPTAQQQISTARMGLTSLSGTATSPINLLNHVCKILMDC